jgi:hypothetical protein
MMRRLAFAFALLTLVFYCAPAPAANWNVAKVNHVTLPAPASGAVSEMSGVTYVGPVGAAHRFIAVQEDHENVVRFDVMLTAEGGIASIANVVNIPIDDDLDFEGIAYTNSTRGSVFLSEEDTPGVREVSLANGDVLQTLTIPAVFATRRSNNGFESLTRTPDASTMWTANEEALTVDGPISSPTAGTVVRLLRFDVNGDAVTTGAQFAYPVEKIHGAFIPDARSGLADLVAMPDGTLLSLERSLAFASPFLLNQVFEISFSGATDVSQGDIASGLAGKAYSPVGKELLWSDTVDSQALHNLEGLGLGPQLSNGDWSLIGVVDSGGSGANVVVSFTASAIASADFNLDGEVDGTDFLAWQRGVGKTVGAKLADGDADRDGDVDAQDLNIWRAQQPAPPAAVVPEPSAGAMLVPGLLILRSLQRPC